MRELGPHIGPAAPAVRDSLRTAFTLLGWDVAANAPVPGSGPPQPVALVEMLEERLAALLPELSTARSAADEAAKVLAAEERELAQLEEEALDGRLSGKQER